MTNALHYGWDGPDEDYFSQASFVPSDENKELFEIKINRLGDYSQRNNITLEEVSEFIRGIRQESNKWRVLKIDPLYIGHIHQPDEEMIKYVQKYVSKLPIPF